MKGVVGSSGKNMPIAPIPKEIDPAIMKKPLLKLSNRALFPPSSIDLFLFKRCVKARVYTLKENDSL